MCITVVDVFMCMYFSDCYYIFEFYLWDLIQYTPERASHMGKPLTNDPFFYLYLLFVKVSSTIHHKTAPLYVCALERNFFFSSSLWSGFHSLWKEKLVENWDAPIHLGSQNNDNIE